MCVIVSKGMGVALPKDEYLRNAADNNKDGIGAALHKAGTNEVIIKKDFLNVEALLTWLHLVVVPEDSLIIHFRIATSGLVDEGNRHPFPITKNKELLRETNLVCQSAVAHNGVLTDYGKHATYSDSQKFILDILSDDAIKNNLTNPTILKLINSFLSRDRLCIMLATGQQILLGDFHEDEKVKYSNLSYKTSYKRVYRGTTENVYNYKHTVPVVTGKQDWCEGCKKTQPDVRKMNYKKAEVNLCKPCRKDLVLDKLDDLLEAKRSGVNLLAYCDTVKCTKCGKIVAKAGSYNPTFGTYFCDECLKNQKDGIECDTCGIKFPADQLVHIENALVCKACDEELKKTDSPVIIAEGETVIEGTIIKKSGNLE